MSWNSYFQLYVAVYSQPLSQNVMFRTSPNPEGPWSRETLAFVAMTPSSGNVYDAKAHSEYDVNGGQTIFVSYSRSTRAPFSSEVRLVEVQFRAPLAGRLVDRFGARRVILPSTAIFGLVLISFKYLATNLWQLYACVIVLGFIGIGTAPVPNGIVISRWFDRRRGNNPRMAEESQCTSHPHRFFGKITPTGMEHGHVQTR